MRLAYTLPLLFTAAAMAAACAGAASPQAGGAEGRTPPPPVGDSGAGLAPAPSPPCLSLATWNDLHGQLGPDDVQVDLSRVPAGGVIALADELAAVRATSDAVVVLDAGDLFTGPIDATLAEGAPVIDAYNVLGVDAVAIGNHEFDFGPVGYGRVTASPNLGDEAGADGPRGALFARMRTARFPFLSANLHRTTGQPLDWPNMRASTRISRGGFDVGVVGYSTVDTPLTTIKPNVVGLDFVTGAAASVAGEIRALRAARAAPVVLLAHASLDGDLPQELDDASDPQGARRVGELAALLDAIPVADRPDVIIAGHRHAWMLGRVRGVPIVSSDQHGVGLTRVRFCRSAPGAAPRLERVERRVAMASNPPSSALGLAVRAAVAPWQAKVKSEADAVVTTLPSLCLAKALDGTALAEQTARAIAERAGDAAAPPKGVPVVGLVNTGSLRAPLRAGTLRYRDLFATSPFENGVSVCGTTRAGLTRLLTNAISVPEAHDRLTFGISGAKVTLTRSKSGGVSVKRLVLDGAGARGGPPPRDEDPVWLAVPDFILGGGDALLEGVTCTTSATSQTRVRDAWQAVLAREHACDGPPKNVVVEGP